MPKNPRLQFTKEERSTPALKKPIRKADKAAARADRVQKNIPKKTKKVKERIVDPATGKKTVRLRFEETPKAAPSSKLTHAIAQAPGRALSSQLHREVGQSDEDNVGVESAHKLVGVAETGIRTAQSAHRAHKLRPYRAAARAERKLEKANVNALYQKSLRENPQRASNPISRWQQKQSIKRQYAAAKRAGHTGKTAENTAKTAKAAARESKRAAAFVWRHKKVFGIIIGLLLVVALLLNTMASCSVMVEGVLSGVAASTYPAEDSQILAAEAAYAGMEDDLQYELDNYQRLHPGYDEYHFDLDEIKHDPYVLISMLSALHPGEWTLETVAGTLQMLFDRQYTLTERVVVETRYDSDDEPYNYYICYVTLENFDLSHLPVYIMDEDALSRYAVYMATLGNRPDLFPQWQFPNASEYKEYTDYDVPPEALEDETFAAMLQEAEKYLGYPYVWGGSNPSTSFDCSGFVSWVINHSGWDVGRLGAQSLYNICTPVSSANAKPGDLIFFVGTYDTPGVSHCGIYVGGGMMIHCGDPISYANINTSYWQSHFYAFGRLP